MHESASKPAGPPPAAIEPADPPIPEDLLRVNIRFFKSSTLALIDSGCIVTICSAELFSRLSANQIFVRSEHREIFRTADGQQFTSLGCYSIPFFIKNTEFRHIFHVAPKLQEQCILGKDFLKQNNLILDTSNKKLHSSTDRNISFLLTDTRLPCFNIITEKQQEFDLSYLNEPEKSIITKIITKYKSIFASNVTELGCTNLVEHHIEVNGPPFARPPYRIPITLRPRVREYVKDMLNSGIIQKSNSEYSSPVVIVLKNNKFRFTTDFRILNTMIPKSNWPIPRIEQALEQLAGSRYFSVIDLKTGFFQVPLAEDSRKYTAFTVEGIGHFEYLRLPQGLKSSPGTFQSLMEKVFEKELNDFVIIYIDDICVHSRTRELHEKHLNIVMQRIKEANLRIAKDKGKWFQTRLDFLGHVIDEHGVSPDERKLKAVSEFPRPKTIKELRGYLGLCNFYRKFVIMYSEKASPLYELLKKKNKTFTWTDAAEGAFQCLKSALISAPLLRYPIYTKPYILYVDTSQKGVGAILSQIQPLSLFANKNTDGAEEEFVVSYFSCHLTDKEAAYSASEKECYGLIRSIKHFFHYLYGTEFTVYTDHAALTYLQTKSVLTNPRLQRWSLFLQDFNFKIIYKKGSTHQNADALSRAPVNYISSTYKVDDFIKAQQEDSFCKIVLSNLEKNPPEGTPGDDASNNMEATAEPPAFHFTKSGLLVNSEGKVVVPNSLQKEILEITHNHFSQGAHFGFHRTLGTLKTKYWWSSMRNDVKEFVAACLLCARRKQKIMPKAPLQPIPTANYIMEICSSDILGPLPESRRGNRYVLLFREFMTKYMFGIAMKDQRADTVVRKSIKHIFLKEGFPSIIITDGGANYQSKLNTSLLRHLGIKQIRITAYHAQANGSAEAGCKFLGDQITMHAHENREIWDDILPHSLYHYNNTPNSDTKDTPNYLFRARDLQTPIDLQPPNRNRYLEDDENIDNEEAEASSFSEHWHLALDVAKSKLDKAKEKQAKYYNQDCREVDFEVGDQVLIKEGKTQTGKFFFRFTSPRIIVKKVSKINYLVKRPGDNHSTMVHCNRMVMWKPARNNDNKADPQPPTASTYRSNLTDNNNDHFDPNDESDFHGFEEQVTSATKIANSKSDETRKRQTNRLLPEADTRLESVQRSQRHLEAHDSPDDANRTGQPAQYNELRSILKTAELEARTGRTLRPRIIRPLRFRLPDEN